VELKVKTYNPNLIVEEIGKALNTKTKKGYIEEVIHLPNDVGEGRILGFKFSDGVGLLLIDCTFKQKIKFEFDESLLSPLLFSFTSLGSLTHISNYGNNHSLLSPFQSTISANPLGSSNVFIFPPNEKVVFSCIVIDRQKFKKKIDAGFGNISEKVKSIFLDTNSEKPFFYQTNYSMSSSIHLQEVIDNEIMDFTRSVYLEGITLELLSSQINQFKNSIANNLRKQTLLSNDDIAKILEVKEILLKNLQDTPTIESLSKKIGVNQTKLKIGFKSIFDIPIITWLRHKRLENAQLLLLKDNKSIKEISEFVGYSNQSHFSKQFRSRYGVLPKDYLKQIKKKRTLDSE